MANYRPAGLSDEESDSDDYGFYEKPPRKYYPVEQQSTRKKTEIVVQETIVNGKVKELEEILTTDLHNNVDYKLDSGWTPLMHACFHAQHKIVQYLLQEGADPNLHSDFVTPLMLACSNSSANQDTIHNIVNDLIEKGCLLNIGDKYGQTPLMRAISTGRVSVVQKLLDKGVNIEMRDQQGWTVVFWAVHHNQQEILEMLIESGSRLTEVDRSNRTLLDIAVSHGYDDIIDILNKHLKKDDDSDEIDISMGFSQDMASWHDYYPGVLKKGEKPNYAHEIPHLLYGMNCERLTPTIVNSGIDLRTFLLLEEPDMERLGITMPYERQRLVRGLRNFHTKGWKLSAVAGLYAKTTEHYSVLKCLTTLGSHLQQLYILEATLQYALREYTKIQDQVKFEPPDSPVLAKMEAGVNQFLTNINNIRREIKSMKKALIKISRSNPQPADLIKLKSATELALHYAPSAVVIVSTIGVIVYNVKHILLSFFNK